MRASSPSWRASCSRRSTARTATCAGGPPEQVEAQVERRDGLRVAHAAAGRSRSSPAATALSSLMLRTCAPCSASSRAARRSGAPPPPRRRRRAASEESPVPELGADDREGEAQGADRRARPGSPRAWPPPCGACSASASRACWSTTPTGYARLVQPDGRGHERLLEIAERMVRARRRGGRGVSCRPRARRTRVLERALARGGDFAELYAEARQGFAHLARRRTRGAPAGRARARRVRARGAGRLDLLRPRRRPRGGGPAARGRVGVRRPCAASATHPRALPRGRAGARRTRSDRAPRTWRPSARRSCCARATSAPAAAGAEVAQVARRLRGERAAQVEVFNSDGRAAADDRTRVRLERPGRGAARRPRRDRQRDARRPRGLRAVRGATPSRWPRRRPARALTLLDAVDAPDRAAAGGGGQRLRRRAAPRGRRPRPRGRRRAEARQRLRRPARRAARRAVRDRLRRRQPPERVGHATAIDDEGTPTQPHDRDRGGPAHAPTCTTYCARARTAWRRPATAAASRSATCRSRA